MSAVLALLVWMFASITMSSGQVQLRLADGATASDGRLEIFYRDEWGLICGYTVELPEAAVACRQLGFLYATDVQRVGGGTGAVVMDDLNCNGDEASILDCYHDLLGRSNCGHSAAVGITCSNVESTVSPVTFGPAATAILNNGKFRLVDGPGPYQGRVEVFVYSARTWLPLCEADWDFTRALFVCQKLGYRPATSAGTGRYGQGSGQMALCSATAFNYENQFNYDRESCQAVNGSDGSVACSHATAADVVCSGVEPGKEGHIRLIGGTDNYEGRVEIYERNLWKGICSDTWRIAEAQVSCLQLALPPPPAAVAGGTYGSSSEADSILQGSPDCAGQERSLTACPQTPRSCSVGDAAIRCGVPAEAQELGLRLVGGRSNAEGRVEILYQGEWGTICHLSWVVLDEAGVICRQLGFLYPDDITSFGPGEGVVVLSGPNCNGNEGSITDCYHNGLGMSSCDHSRDLGVVCSNIETVMPSPDPSLVDSKIRLVGGADPYQGRVEVYIDQATGWATMCGTEWDFKQAALVCEKLGYRPATAAGTGRYGVGTGPIAVCPSMDYTFKPESCQIANPNNVSCTHEEDADVVCNGREPGTQGYMHLVNGSEPTEGRIELYDKNAWKTMCADDISITEAKIVCRGFNMPVPTATIPGGMFGASDAYDIMDEVVSCTGQERHIRYCSRTPRLTPCVGGEAAVRCGSWKDAKEGDVRLSGGLQTHEGEVEVFHDGQWGRVCQDSWDTEDARVVCRQLGYLTDTILDSNAIGSSRANPPLLKDLWCNGWEDSILDCRAVLGPADCDDRYLYAEVMCDTRPVAKYYELRLSDGPYPNQGRVELLYNGSWGTLCDDGWDLYDARVVCNQLGFPSAVVALDGDATADLYGEGVGDILMYELDCTGEEESLIQCLYNNRYTDICSHSEDASVVCYSDSYPSEKPRPTDGPGGGGLSGTQIRNIILGVLIGCKVLLIVCWCGYRQHKRAQEPTIEVITPVVAAGNQYQPVNQDPPPTYNEATKDSGEPTDSNAPTPASASAPTPASAPMPASAPAPPVCAEPDDKAAVTTVV